MSSLNGGLRHSGVCPTFFSRLVTLLGPERVTEGQMDAAGVDVEALYERYGPMVLRRCRFLLRDEDQALDTTHDVFVQLLTHRERLTAAYPSSLLYRIATNLCLNRIRDR